MLVYHKESYRNLDIQKRAASWLKKNLITKEEYLAIEKAFPTSYHESGTFMRIGMFIFTVIVVVSAATLLNMFILFSIHYFGIHGIVYGLVFFGAAYFFVTEKKHFRSGVTDGLVYSSAVSFSAGVFFMIAGREYNFDHDPVMYLFSVLPWLVFLSVYFSDAFLAVLCYAGVFTLNALLVLKAGATGRMILPFESMILSFIAFRFFSYQCKREKNYFWRPSLTSLKASGLVTLYLSGNYFVVRQLSEMLPGMQVVPGEDIGLAGFFYAYTIVIPMVYVWLGLKRKDHLFIRLGMILEVAGILGIRYYHSFLPAETALTAAGIFLIVAAWLSIRYLKTPRFGISYEDADPGDAGAFETVGAVLLSNAAGKVLQQDDSVKFGGGSSGGGGAGGAY